MKKVHIQGMGVVGCMLAWAFHTYNVDFEWNDINNNVCAWKASTGSVYPTGNVVEYASYRKWRDWSLNEIPWWSKMLERGLLETAAYWFLTKTPPLKGTFSVPIHVGPLWMGAAPSVHVNVQNLVVDTRDFFRSLEKKKRNPSRHLIIAHGFSKKLFAHHQWGWSATTKLRVDPSLLAHCNGRRPSFVLQRRKGTPLALATVMPGTGYWYASGSAVPEGIEAGSYLLTPTLQKWADRVEYFTEGLVKVHWVMGSKGGWSPCGVGGPTVFRHGKTIYVGPQGNAGVHMAPEYTRRVLEELSIINI